MVGIMFLFYSNSSRDLITRMPADCFNSPPGAGRSRAVVFAKADVINGDEGGILVFYYIERIGQYFSTLPVASRHPALGGEFYPPSRLATALPRWGRIKKFSSGGGVRPKDGIRLRQGYGATSGGLTTPRRFAPPLDRGELTPPACHP